jgi:hypothetical protein
MNTNLKIQTVIINVGTPESSTLALLSALRYTNFLVTVIDCPIEGNNNEEYFNELKKDYNFELRTMPLNIHGKTLDSIFASSDYDYVLLLDSDAELLCSDFLAGSEQYIERDDCFGAGYVHGPFPMNEGSMTGWKYLYYQERMYIPCTLLKVSAICTALKAGQSFEAKKWYNDFPIQFFARLCYYRFAFKFWQNHEFIFSLPFRKRIHSFYKPSMVYYDTGAEIYCYLKYRMGMNFIGLPYKYHTDKFAHYHGITRNLLNKRDKNSTNLSDVSDLIMDRLRLEYNFDIMKYIHK